MQEKKNICLKATDGFERVSVINIKSCAMDFTEMIDLHLISMNIQLFGRMLQQILTEILRIYFQSAFIDI